MTVGGNTLRLCHESHGADVVYSGLYNHLLHVLVGILKGIIADKPYLVGLGCTALIRFHLFGQDKGLHISSSGEEVDCRGRSRDILVRGSRSAFGLDRERWLQGEILPERVTLVLVEEALAYIDRDVTLRIVCSHFSVVE